MPFAFLEFEAEYLRAYWLERSSFLKSCTAKLLLNMSQNFRRPKKICGEVTSKNKLKTPKFLRTDR